MNIRKIIGLFLFMTGVVGIIGSKDETETLVFAIVLTIIGFILFLSKVKTNEEKNQNNENDKKKMETVIYKLDTEHQYGLPISTGVTCTVLYDIDKFTFIGGGNTFNLAFNKITDVCIKTDTEIQKHYVSSIGGAVAGGVILGPLGAIVGGRAKEKKTSTSTDYLIFTYLKNGEINYISFNVTNNWAKVDNIVNKVKKNNVLAEAKVVKL